MRTCHRREKDLLRVTIGRAVPSRVPKDWAVSTAAPADLPMRSSHRVTGDSRDQTPP